LKTADATKKSKPETKGKKEADTKAIRRALKQLNNVGNT
jgi:hypothetical protein